MFPREQRANVLKSTCLKWLTSETIEQIPNLALMKWGKCDYKWFDKIVLAAIKYSENDKGKITNLLRPSRPSCVQKPAFSWAPRFAADERLWISPSVEVSHHPPSLLGRPWNSVYHLRRIKSALFGFQWTPVFLWLATRISSGFRPCSGFGWTRNRNAVWLAAPSDGIPLPCPPCRLEGAVPKSSYFSWK